MISELISASEVGKNNIILGLCAFGLKNVTSFLLAINIRITTGFYFNK